MIIVLDKFITIFGYEARNLFTTIISMLTTPLIMLHELSMLLHIPVTFVLL